MSKSSCYHCEEKFLERHLQTLEDKLLHNGAKFRKAFKDDPGYDSEATKFCRACARKWKLLSTKRGSNVDEYISKMKSEMKRNKKSNQIQDTTGSSGCQNTVYVEKNDEIMKKYTDAKIERDFWRQKWIDEFCSNRVDDTHTASMKVYAKNWKNSEKKVNQFKEEYYGCQ